MIKKSFVTLFRLTWDDSYFSVRENWFVNRESGMSYSSSLEGEEAAEEAYHLTNAPEELLSEDQKRLLNRLEFKGRSLSTGDVVKVEPVVRGSSFPEYYLCKSHGWEKYEGDTISLLKHLV